VILVDVNILVYARNIDCDEHERIRTWLDSQLSSPTAVGFPWPSVLGFVRVATNPRAFKHPLKIAEAWDQAIAWLGAEPSWIPQPSERHAEILGELLAQGGVYGNLVPDAHLAALAIEHGLTLCSTDGDFARFRQLRWLNPLAS